jgi:cation diffusion facilitator CzcD-associated flavoprotein CzcO
VAIIGAGPNGLALAAHLRDRGVEHRIFGSPMQTWRDLPTGMNLKSLGFATTIPMPGGATFPEYCRSRGLEDYEPIDFQTLTQYGLDLQRRFVPYLEDTKVTHLERSGSEFVLTLATGERLRARRVVVAIGLGYFPRIPAPLDQLPDSLVCHTWGHKDFAAYAGKDVVVVGGGSSALETAVLLHEHGVRVRVLARSNAEFGMRGRREHERPLLDRIRVPLSTLGHGRENWVLEHLPWLMYHVPPSKRIPFTRRHLGPAAAWWLRPRAEGKFPIETHTSIIAATVHDGKVRLRVRQADHSEQELTADHVIAGTGYEMDLKRIPFLAPELGRSIQLWDKMPRLSRQFESSVPGLFFIGPIAAESFGPLVRFIAGAQFTVGVLSNYLAGQTRVFGMMRRRTRRGTESILGRTQVTRAHATGEG